MSSWHYTKDGQAVGPVPFESLRQLAISGELPEGTLVWTQGMPNWVPPSEVPGLTASSAQTVAETVTPATENPYAAPSSAANLADTASADDLEDIVPGSEPLRIDMLISKSWDIFKRNVGIIFGLGIVYIVIVVASSLIINKIFPGPGLTFDLGLGPQYVIIQPDSIPAQIINGIISLFLSLGAIRFGLNLLRGHNASIPDLFSQGQLLVRCILATILLYLLIAAAVLPGAAVAFAAFNMNEGGGPNIPVLVIGILVAFIPTAYVTARMTFVHYSFVDRDSSTIDALKDSWALTKGNALRIILLFIVQMLLIVGGILALLVGLLIAFPVVFLSTTVAYGFLRHGWRAAAIK